MHSAQLQKILAFGSVFILYHAIAHSQSLESPVLNKDLFTKNNIKILCHKVDGQLRVKREALALSLLKMGAPFDSLAKQEEILAKATQDGKEVKDVTDAEIIHFVSSSKPFGINRNYTPEEVAAQNAQLPALTALWQWFDSGHTRNKFFKLVGPTLSTDPERYFQKNSKYEIECGERRDVPPQPTGFFPKPWDKNVVIRKKVSDISVDQKSLKKANGAQLSLSDDAIKKKQVLSVEGLVGIVVSGTGADRAQELGSPALGARDLYWFKLVPYVYYKSVTNRPTSKGSKDIDYFIPGVTGNFTVINASNTFSYDLQLEASNTRDIGNDSSVYNFGVRFSPSFYDGKTVIFGASIGLPGTPLAVRPDLALTARQFVIETAGVNADLKGIRTYTGLGFDATAHFYLDIPGSPLSDFVAKVGYAYQENSNDVPDVMRFSAGLSYVINTNLTVDFDYVNGRDPNTLQDEERWTVALSFRN
ncbi:MAG TPA: hypothetical protein VG758_07115 [Hyphomicrobiaceae bacterium]|nr:hypothetical protein [Hyphomicrobiaceae bacterium]